MILTAGICDDSVLNLNTFSSVVRWPNNVSDIYEKIQENVISFFGILINYRMRNILIG